MDWRRLNDHIFVHLVADLLRRLGFADVQVQGSGPDGGLDLIATQLVSLGLQDRRPFRWGIQCKFSVSGTQSSVTDSDVRDVEGVLRSDRYARQQLRGYMLVTNRKVAQNVVERLQGIDQTSVFRTSWIDGPQLQHRLSEYSDLLQKYFGEISSFIHDLGAPDIVVPTSIGSGFVVEAVVGLPSGLPNVEQRPHIKAVKALVDTGASWSAVPGPVLRELGAMPIDATMVVTVGGVSKCHVYAVRFDFGTFEIPLVRVVSIDYDFAMIGRDILDEMVMLIDGPSRVAKLWRGRM